MFRCVTALLTIAAVLGCPFTCAVGQKDVTTFATSFLKVAALSPCGGGCPCHGDQDEPAPADGCALDCICKVLVEASAKVPTLGLLWSPLNGIGASFSSGSVSLDLGGATTRDRNLSHTGLKGGSAIRIAHASLLI